MAPAQGVPQGVFPKGFIRVFYLDDGCLFPSAYQLHVNCCRPPSCDRFANVPCFFGRGLHAFSWRNVATKQLPIHHHRF